MPDAYEYSFRLCTPTSNKRLNELVGFLYFVFACLLLLALASYSPLDPSLNTATAVSARHPAHNWVGVVGAMASDLLLQIGGVAVLLIPVFVGLLGWRWFRSLRVDSAAAKAIGAAMLFLFASALLGLLPWHWRSLRVIPAEGLSGRILANVMVRYLNRSGAYIVCLALIAVGLFLATKFSFSALQLWFQTRFSFLHAIIDRYHDCEQHGPRPRRRKSWRSADEPRPLSSKPSTFPLRLRDRRTKPPSFASKRTTHLGKPLLHRRWPNASRLAASRVP